MSSPFQPSTYDFQNPTLFRLVFSRIPNVAYESYSANIPGITLPEATHVTPTRNIPRFGDKIVFEPLVVNFIVQEDLANWREIHAWMMGLGKPYSTAQHKTLVDSGESYYSDASLMIMTNKSNPVIKVKFYDCWPTALSPLSWDAGAGDATEPITADVTFNYSYYEFETL